MADALTAVAAWTAGAEPPAFEPGELVAATHRAREPAWVVRDPATGRVGVGFGGSASERVAGAVTYPVLGALPALYPEWLGDRSFCDAHGVRFPYVAGAMANGIASTSLVLAMARAGFLAFFGAAGLSPERVERSLVELEDGLGRDGPPWGSNLIHSPNEPDLEATVSDLYVRRGVRRVSASAYMNLTPHVVRYAYAGVTADGGGRIRRPNHVFAKISRAEVARRFLEPAPGEILDTLLAQGKLTADEVEIARRLPVAEDITVEADSGGHTDNQVLTALFPVILSLRNRLVAEHRYQRPVRVGTAGGLGAPAAVAAAFSLGAAYVLTGSVNQSCVESGLCSSGRDMLAVAGPADVVMAPAADMFELGVEVQVLKRGTMFATRARKLYELYRGFSSLDELPAAERERLEKEILGQPVAAAWTSTRDYWANRDPREVDKAEGDPKHRMALVFRSYLGQSSRWAIDGVAERRMDYQIWCGPAMGAFNAWSEGSFLAEPEQRTVVQVARNLLEGAAVITRAHQLRSYGVPMPATAFDFRPRPLA
jgi:PfaD family protein